MKFVRWLLSFPGAVLASFLGWALALEIFSGVGSTYGGGFVRSAVGLLPLFISAAVPTVIFILAGVLISPSKGRKVCFAFFGLSLLFSAGGLHMLQHQDGYLGFWLASAAGVVGGGLMGLATALPFQRRRAEPAAAMKPGRSSRRCAV